MREVDRLMPEEFGISLEQMMENAGRHLADFAIEMLPGESPDTDEYRVVVACGAGNNGGGGMVAARFLSNRGIHVTALLAAPESDLKPIPAKRWKTLGKLPVKMAVANEDVDLAFLQNADLVIDAIIGYGLEGSLGGVPARVARQILDSGNPSVLALDVPSGLDSTAGTANGICVKAKATLTLALPKTGLVKKDARTYVGDLFVADIGVPPELYARFGHKPLPLFKDRAIIPVK